MLLLIAGLAILLPLAANALSGAGDSPLPWYKSSMASTGLAPDPAATPEAVVQVYAAPAFAWRGVFAVHTWVATKRSGEEAFTRWDVVGWGGPPTIKHNFAAVDGQWFGKRPVLLLDRRGDGVEALIDGIEAAVASYPYDTEYRSWPGPNSNTFTAHVARSVPDLRLDLPANAVGKDYLAFPEMVARAPSGTGFQVSLAGALGFTLALEEGIELNLLGLNLGVDVFDPALRLPGIGRLPGSTTQFR